jgi:hypothetical protein
MTLDDPRGRHESRRHAWRADQSRPATTGSSPRTSTSSRGAHALGVSSIQPAPTVMPSDAGSSPGRAWSNRSPVAPARHNDGLGITLVRPSSAELTNAQMDSHSPFACLLVGQPTLRRRIKLGTFAALEQRIALRFAMPAMTAAETGTYVAHHLKLAGRADTLFSDDALGLVHQVSRGLPRAVNNLALQSLVAAYAARKAIVDESSARAAVTEVTAE